MWTRPLPAKAIRTEYVTLGEAGRRTGQGVEVEPIRGAEVRGTRGLEPGVSAWARQSQLSGTEQLEPGG